MKKIIFLLLITYSYLSSEPMKVGEELTLIQYETQKDEKVSLSKETRTLVFTSEMEASKIAHELFEVSGDEYLNKNSTVFISDINKMPFLITKFVALPRMRKYNYTIHLIKENGPGNIFPREKGKLTVINLENYKITNIQFIGSVDELKISIEKK